MDPVISFKTGSWITERPMLSKTRFRPRLPRVARNPRAGG